MKAIIIDDEHHSRDTTKMLLEMTCPGVEIIAMADNAIEGAKLINTRAPDVIFLDIQMPGTSGIEMLDFISNYQGEIIFITAHDKYAIEAFKKGALHFLLKPLDPDDLAEAVKRVAQNTKPKIQKSNGKWLSLSTQEGWIVLKKRDIFRCESFKNYTTIVTEKAKHTISKTMKDVEAILPKDIFYRVHASHIINIEKVERVLKSDGGNVRMKNNDLIPISKGKKKEFFEWFQNKIDIV